MTQAQRDLFSAFACLACGLLAVSVLGIAIWKEPHKGTEAHYFQASDCNIMITGPNSVFFTQLALRDYDTTMVGMDFDDEAAFHDYFNGPFLKITLYCGCVRSWETNADVKCESVKCEHGNYFIRIKLPSSKVAAYVPPDPCAATYYYLNGTLLEAK